MKILENKSKKFGFIGMFSVLALLVSGMLMASPSGNTQKEELTPLIIDNFSLDLSLYNGNPKMTNSNLLKMFTLNKEVPLIGITNSKKIIIIDLSAKKIIQTLEIPDIHAIVTVDGCKDYFIHHGKIMQLSRYDSQSWEKRWTILYPFTGDGAVKIQETTTFFDIAMLMNRIPDTNTLYLKGVRFFVQSDSNNDNLIPMYGLIKINMDTGKTIEEINYAFRRKLGNNLSLYMNETLTNFDIINDVTGEITISGNCEPDDLLFKKDRYYIIDLKSLKSIMPFGWDWDFSGIVTEGGTILFSRKYSNTPFKTGISKSSWVYFDAEGNRLKKVDNIYPMMLSRIPNLTKEAFPMLIPNNKHEGRAFEIDYFWMIEKDGTMTKVWIPLISGIKRYYAAGVFFQKWFHNKKEIYLSRKGTLYNFTIGDLTARTLLQGDKKTTTYEFITGKVHIYAMKIVNGVGNTLMRLSDQKVGIPSEFSDDLPPKAWSQIVDLSRRAIMFPKNVMGNNKLKYTKYSHTKNGHRIWGDFDTLNKLGDITNLTAFRTDNTAVLVGMRIPENTLEYRIPLLHIPSFKNIESLRASYLPYTTFRINEKEALILVFKTLNQIKVYRIKRPGMVL